MFRRRTDEDEEVGDRGMKDGGKGRKGMKGWLQDKTGRCKRRRWRT